VKQRMLRGECYTIGLYDSFPVTAELGFPVTTPNLNRVALIGQYTQCRPQ